MAPTIIPWGDPLAYKDPWDAFWTEFDAREARKSRGPLRVLDVDELEASLRGSRTAAFEAQACAELVDPAFGADPVLAAFAATKPFLTTREATAYCGFKTAGALRKAKLEGRIAPAGRRGGSGTLMWSREVLDATSRARRLLPSPLDVRERLRRPPEVRRRESSGFGSGTVGWRRNRLCRESIDERREGFWFEGEPSIRRIERRGRLSEACRT